MIANDSLIKRMVVVKSEKGAPKKFPAARPNLSPVAARLRLLTRSRRGALPS